MLKKLLIASFLSALSLSSFAEVKPVPSDAASTYPIERGEILEFFSFGCPHCNDFEPSLDKWKTSNPQIKVRKVAVGFNKSWQPLQKLYFTLETMAVPSSKYKEVFESIHEKHENLFTDDNVLIWAVKHGYDQKKFLETYKSFTVHNKVKAAEQLVSAYRLEGVPTIAVNSSSGISLVGVGKGGFPELLSDLDQSLKLK